MRYSERWPDYAHQWDTMQIRPSLEHEFEREAQYAVDFKIRYQEIERLTGVPWALVAVIHRREAAGAFGCYLGNGESLSHRTVTVPKGRGPFTGPNAFERGAVDALHLDGLDAVRDWRLEKQLYYTELFNGTGYFGRGIPSPYVWGGTNIQKPGKYVADHVWDGHVMDIQLGTAPLLATIARLDPSVTFTRETPPETA